MSAPIFDPDVNVIGLTLQFEQFTDAAGPRAGMGNEDWVAVDNPLYDPAKPNGHGPKDFPGCVPVVDQPLSQTLARGGTNETTQSGSLFAPKAYAEIIEPDWRFEYQGVKYHIIGKPSWDYLHPLTGEDFGYVEFTVRKGG